MTIKTTITDSSQPSLQELEHALKIAAKVVAMYGDIYLPTFMRVQIEVFKAKEATSAKSYAIRLASEL